MKRHEIAAVIAAAFALIVSGLTWLAGSYGPLVLIGSGAVALGLAVFVLNLKED